MDLKTAISRLSHFNGFYANSRAEIARFETDGYGNVYDKIKGVRRAILICRFPDWHEACKQLRKLGFERTGKTGQGFRGIWKKV